MNLLLVINFTQYRNKALCLLLRLMFVHSPPSENGSAGIQVRWTAPHLFMVHRHTYPYSIDDLFPLFAP